MENPLTDILTPSIRRQTYLFYSLVTLAAGAIQIGFSTAGLGQPVWLRVSLAVIAFLGTGLGLTAASNVKNTNPTPADAPATTGAPAASDAPAVLDAPATAGAPAGTPAAAAGATS
ncbi:MAG: hypothetical protein ACR2LI_11955 [Propionibacteriaceae bacterium]